MASSLSPNLVVRETKVFVLPVRTSKKALIIVLLSGDNANPSVGGTLTIDVAPPVSMVRMPAGTWQSLWPAKPEPSGWAKVTLKSGKIELTPKAASSAMGGVVAFYGPESSLPVNMKTEITYLNDSTYDTPISATEKGKWDSIFAGMTPRLPLPRLTHIAKEAKIASRPTRYIRKRPTQARAGTTPAASRLPEPTETARSPVASPPAPVAPAPVAPVPETTPPTVPETASLITPPSSAPLAPTSAMRGSKSLKKTGCPWSDMYQYRRNRSNKVMYAIIAIFVLLILGAIFWFIAQNCSMSGAAKEAVKSAATPEKRVF